MNAKVKTVLGFILFAALIAGAFFAYSALSKKAEVTAVSAVKPAGSETEKITAPDFSFTKEDGTRVRLSDFAGKPVIINFWASWCPPCKAELPDFQKLYNEVGESVAFLMIDLVDGQRETVAKGAKFMADAKYTLPVYYDTLQEGAYFYGISAIPTTIFIDSQGNVAAAQQGQLNESLLRKGIALIYN